MKKKNLTLQDLKVSSFVTNDNKLDLKTVKGGDKLPYTKWRGCSDVANCGPVQTITQCTTKNLCETMVADQCMD